jgi:hypothetical protein
MADTRSTAERDAARNRAQQHFAASDRRDIEVKQMIEGERSAMDARIAKLRALRLAKEEADRAAAANAPQAEPAKDRPRKPSKRKSV